VLLSNCSSASTEIPEELSARGKPSSAVVRATSEQAAPSANLKEPAMVETNAKQMTSEQVPPRAPGVEHAATEERKVLEPRQETLEQSAATPSTPEGVLPDAVARGKTSMVLSKPGSSLGHAEARSSR
jgi:hypothetical protein